MKKPVCPECEHLLICKETFPKGCECPKCHKWVSTYSVGMAGFFETEEIPNGIPSSVPDKNWSAWYLKRKHKQEKSGNFQN